ncbi:VOC family protein [Hydrogenophaga sp.]|uniref:VOC family protein n=1 Tax=Hydrogenophaga sp. TaxID=1904254 RepID=UPI003F6F40AF
MNFKPQTASVVYYVSDIERTESFYTDTLGLKLERMEGAEPFWLQGRLENGLEIVFFQQEAVRGNTPALVFTVPDGGIDDVVANLASKGVTIVTPVTEAPGGWSADFLDPDGFALGLWQSLEYLRTIQRASAGRSTGASDTSPF